MAPIQYFLVFMSVAIAGCARHEVQVLPGDSVIKYESTEGTAVGVRVATPETQARLNRVGYLTRDLDRRVGVQGSGAIRNQTNTLQVWATFRNRTDYPQKIQARTQYFGENGIPIEGPDAWQDIYLPSNGIQTYRTNSSTIGIDYYYIEIQEMP